MALRSTAPRLKRCAGLVDCSFVRGEGSSARESDMCVVLNQPSSCSHVQHGTRRTIAKSVISQPSIAPNACLGLPPCESGVSVRRGAVGFPGCQRPRPPSEIAASDRRAARVRLIGVSPRRAVPHHVASGEWTAQAAADVRRSSHAGPPEPAACHTASRQTGNLRDGAGSAAPAQETIG